MSEAAPRRRVGVGVGVIVTRGEEILIGQRQGSLGEGEWALPGGHLECGESFESCAEREVLEETGIGGLWGVRLAAVENVVFPSTGDHYVVIFMQGNAPPDAEAALLEPRKCRGWAWARWEELPEPLFLPLRQLRDRGFVPDRRTDEAE